MADPLVTAVVDEGLGNTSYLVDLGDGRALAVDPSRDLRVLKRAAAANGLTISFAADTHLHADFLTGASRLATADDATILASAGGNRRYPHRPLHDGDEVDLGGLRLQTITTPGHTDEHVAYVLLDGARPLGVFTGGSLIVGAAARTDLLGSDRAHELARAQFASVRRLMALPDDVAVWPTHGAGSFCAAPPEAERTSTIGRQRATNPLLQLGEADFVAALVGPLGSYPPYFHHLTEVNRAGPAPIDGTPILQPLGPAEVARLAEAGTAVVDVRPIAAFAEAHLPGSISIELRDAFATWLGWLVPFGEQPVVVRDRHQDPDEIVWQAAKIGYSLRGELAGGIAAWVASGRSTTAISLAAPDETAQRPVLDVRQTSEYADGHVADAAHIELGEIPSRINALPRSPYVVMCGHGERAMSAASLIERAGQPAPVVLLGGPEEWAATHPADLVNRS
ncbi:MAG TPA: MBL fold metallo-hydrolase [Mycobacteriales bacterium]|nr:MBL fold metallo-hydrolase [Mycobacteriales bacterium]